ncbi:N-6 DNA methylase [Methylovorus glucosotrophus]|uniref:site-specific DNA-methyltransferase (adenine-specific) n=1 Tax=Methylovorus glucosotrophus (strain SIP3-4) TaxID=582744 RepID=C6X7Y7_METGS|nr:N-6 DNA methylase [Methylovorus glucosotrophus]ACT51314.1 hypothetical protein Msip34_2072 [Methylovorus glucosotrophus SIP3-4]
MTTNKISISKLIEQIIQKSNYRLKPKDVFDDIIQLTFNCVFSGQVQYEHNLFIDYWIDPALKNAMTKNRYSEDNYKLLTQATGLFVNQFKTNEPFTNIVGEMYDEYLGDVLGQFLTPNDVADLVAELHFEKEPITKNKIIADDMGCGSGSLILASLRNILKNHGKEALKHIELVAMDIDMKMVQLCSIQIVLHCLFHRIEINNLKMYWANTLTLLSPKDNSENVLALVWVQNKEVSQKMKSEKYKQDTQEFEHAK